MIHCSIHVFCMTSCNNKTQRVKNNKLGASLSDARAYAPKYGFSRQIQTEPIKPQLGARAAIFLKEGSVLLEVKTVILVKVSKDIFLSQKLYFLYFRT